MGDQQCTSLPEHLRTYFWDYDAEALDWEQNRHTITLRLVQVGGLDAVTWIRSRISDDDLKDFIVRRQGRGMDPRHLRFWGVLLGIPRSLVDGWVAAARANPWNQRTHG